jgi:hypothetical protein
LLTIVLSRGDVILLGEAYAFGVIWSFAMKGLGVMVLRFKQAGPREFRVPLNFKLDGLELPIGLGLITLTLFATAIINLFTKEIATIAGISFTLLFFLIFTVSEHITRRRGTEHAELDQFHLAPGEEITPQSVGVRPGNITVMVRDYNTLYPLTTILDRIDPEKIDVVVMHIRLLHRGGSGEHDLNPDQLFTFKEQELFTRALGLAEKKGKPIHLAVAAANEIWDGVLRTAQNLEATTVILGSSSKMQVTEEARRAGLAWEHLPDPKPQLSLEIYNPAGVEHIFYLGPHAPRLTPKEIEELHRLWLRFSNQLGEQELHHHDIIHFALHELAHEISEGKEREVLERLRQHLGEIQARRVPHL